MMSWHTCMRYAGILNAWLEKALISLFQQRRTFMSWDPTQRPQPDGGQGQGQGQGQDPYSGYGSPQNPYGAPQPNPSDPNAPPQNPYGTPPPAYNPPPQSPYGNQGYPGGYQQARPSGSSSLSLDTLKDKKNLGFVIAGGAAIIGFIAFFLPYVTGSVSFIVTESVSYSGASGGGLLWLEEICALLVAVISGVLVFRNNAFGLTNMPVEQQIKISRIVLIVAAVLALVVHLIAFANLQAAGAGSSYLGGAVSVSLGFGFWLFMLAAIAMVVGGVIVLRTPASTPGMSQTYGQYPSQPSQYPPYQPPQQYPPYQQ